MTLRTALRLSALLAAAGLLFPSAVNAQSFDCGKARTAAERAICAAPALGALDVDLAAALKQALAARPEQRASLLAAQREWLAARDKSCATASVDCLSAAYRDRIAALRAGSPDAAGRSAPCDTLARRYRTAVGAEATAGADGPLDTLTKDPAAGVVVAKPVEGLTEYSRAAMQAWAKRQGFSLPRSLLAKLDEDAGGQGLSLDQLPKTSYFAASSIQGTAACYYGVYFKATGRKAITAAAPTGWEAESCGLARAFGTIDGAPVAFQEAAGYTPDMSAQVTVSPWRGDGFGPACKVVFDYAPTFATKGDHNDWEESCTGADCAALKQAALTLVEAVQKNPLQAQKDAEAALTPAQKTAYAALLQRAGDAGDPPQHPGDPSEYTDQAPLRLPFPFNDQLFLASVGHETVGWRIFSDWRVLLQQQGKDALKQRAVFAIGMARGKLVDARVK